MKKIIASLVILQLLISGCSLFNKPPQQAVNEGIVKFADVKKMNSLLALTGTIQAPQGEKPSKVQFTLGVNGKSDITDKESPKIEMEITIRADVDDKSGMAAFTLRSVDKKMFINVGNVKVAGVADADLKTQLASLLQTWFSLPVSQNNPFGQLADEQKKLQDKFKAAHFFMNAQEDGTEDVHGMKNTRYRVELDKDELKKFLLDTARTAENQVTPQEEQSVADSLKDVDFSGAIFVGDDNLVHRIRGTVSVQPKQGSTSSYDIDYQAWDYGQDVAVIAPESPKEFNAGMLLPLVPLFSSFEEASTGTTTPGTTTPAAPAKKK